ncbi:MAG: hypothetical protein NC489_09035 [Ruminococcus flavefaciens]|nr:hypothetical protein [Ruminococcus flavefaciens]
MAGRVLTAQQQSEAFKIMGDVKDLDANRMCKLFGRFRKPGSRESVIMYHLDDVIKIGPNESPFVKEGSLTTLGIYIVNKFIIEDLGIFGYINKTFNKKVHGSIDDQMANAMMVGDITPQQYANYIDRCQYLFGGPLSFLTGTSVSETIITLPPRAKKRREELLKENAEGLRANDPQVAAHIEKEVVSIALEEMRKTKDPAMALFDSGCGVDPYNNYKTICVMKGAIEDNTGESPTGYKIVTSNYDTGVSKEDMPKIADTVVTSSFSSGVATQDSGANGKKYNALFQNVRLQDRVSDCGTKQTLPTKITGKHMFRYVVVNGKLVLITPENFKEFEGKVMPMRSGIYCKAKPPQYCAHCIGDRPYRVGIRNIGLTFMTVSGSTLNASLKKKHDVSIKMYEITMDDIMKYVK